MSADSLMATRTPRVCAADATVERVTRVCREHVKVDVALEAFPVSCPGQFLQLLCAPPLETASRDTEVSGDGFPAALAASSSKRDAYLRRPFSIADRWEERKRVFLSIISRNIGPGTGYLDRLSSGQVLNISGPFGRGFVLPDGDRPLLLVGGGVGIPPLLYLARELDGRRYRNVTVVLGAMSRDLLPVPLRTAPNRDGTPSACAELPAGAAFATVITTDDGTLGMPGRVTDALDRLRGEFASGDPPLVLACGPEGMLKAVARQTRSFGWGCQLCIERHMGCGFGTCLSCVVRSYDAQSPAGWRWALACSEGPVFDRDRLPDYAD